MGGDNENGPKRRQTRRLGPRCVFFEYKCFYHIYFRFITMKRQPVPTPPSSLANANRGWVFHCLITHPHSLANTSRGWLCSPPPPPRAPTTSPLRRPPHHHVTHHHAAHATMSCMDQQRCSLLRN